MTRAQAVGLSSAGVLLGGGLLIFVVTSVPPELASGEPNSAALLMALVSAMVLAGGIGMLLALTLHKRWPGLAGASGATRVPEPAVALRQGFLISLGTGFILTLAYRGMLDAPFFVVTILLLVLLEAFIQSRT
ncbi:MAG: hypothetical protein ACK2UO_13405 [Caldilineaceae bacterium]|jgi:hypothetical protein